MANKSVKKISNYARSHGLTDVAITKEGRHHVLRSLDNHQHYQLKIDDVLASDLADSYRRLLELAPDDLVSNAYLKDGAEAMRLSIIPGTDGEKIILRFINKKAGPQSLSRLGLNREARKIIRVFLKHKRGLIVVVADDNQGKTATLQALAKELINNQSAGALLEKYPETKIDYLDIIQQTKDRARYLEKLTNSDYDWLALDDADEELLTKALTVAQKGRLVIAAYRNNQPAQLTAWLKNQAKENLPLLIIYQELKDKNCTHCLASRPANHYQGLLDRYWPDDKLYRPTKFFHGRGCPSCNHSGTSGQTAVFGLEESAGKNIINRAPLGHDLVVKAANGLIAPDNPIL